MLVWLGLVLYLVPIAVVIVARARPDRTLWQTAIDVPTTVAADMLFVLVLSRALHLEAAAIASRPLWVLGGALLWLRRRRRGEAWGPPRDLGARAIAAAAGGAAIGAALSMHLSRRYHIWDRYWHINLVTSIRGQRLPFANVYDPTGPLSYHYSGDALAAMLQSFSLGSLHASHALALVHDLMFALSGATLALLVVSWGARGVWAAWVASAAWFLSGPPALLRDDDKQWAGYNFVNYVTLSFRPHVSVAGLLIVGFVGAVVARVREAAALDEPRARAAATAVPLVLLTAALSVTDEASCAMLGLALGAAWLVSPDALGLDRRRGFLLLVGLVIAIFVANLAVAGLLSPGAERPGMKLVAWRSPGFANPTLLFTVPNGKKYFLSDVAALLVYGAAAAWAWVRLRARPVAASSAVALVLVGAGVFALGRFDIPPKAVEAHRFVTAPMLVCPLLAIGWLCDRRYARAPFVRVASLVAIAVPALSTLSWIRSPGKTPFQTNKSFYTADDFLELDCREELGARLGERPRPTYLATPVFFVYSGCHPIFTSGMSGGHRIKTSRPLFDWDALADIDRNVATPDEPIDVVCPRGGGTDPVCQFAHARSSCTYVGMTRRQTEVVRCSLTPAERRELLATRSVPASKPKRPTPQQERKGPDEQRPVVDE